MKKGNQDGAYTWELQHAVRDLMRLHPEIRKYKLLETLKELSERSGFGPCYHYVIFTPPYRCRCQPTELQWNFIKVKAADVLDNRSKFKDLLRVWVLGTLEVTDDFCKNWVQNSMDYCTTTYREFTGDHAAEVGKMDNDWKDPYEPPQAAPAPVVVAPANNVLRLDAQPIQNERGDENATDVVELVQFGYDDEYDVVVREDE